MTRRRTNASRNRSQESERTHRETVVPLELFFDLVIVFAFTQVTGLLSADPNWTGVLDGLLLHLNLLGQCLAAERASRQGPGWRESPPHPPGP